MCCYLNNCPIHSNKLKEGKMEKKSAIILGSTGLTGKFVIHMLLKDERYGSIKIFSRSKIGIVHPKLEEHIGDILHLEKFRDLFFADEVYCCIGTTKAKTPQKDLYKKIDYGIPVTAARLCKEKGINTIVVISALGANPKSKLFYNRTKGLMEKEVLNCKIPNTYLLQPSLISGKREEKRLGEWLGKQLMGLFHFVLVGPLEKYRPIAPDTIAKAMVWLCNHDYETVRLESDEIKYIAQK